MTLSEHTSFEFARAKRRRKIAQWITRNPLSSWHDSTVMRPRVRASDGVIVFVRSGGAELRAMGVMDLIPISPPLDPYNDTFAPVQTQFDLARAS